MGEPAVETRSSTADDASRFDSSTVHHGRRHPEEVTHILRRVSQTGMAISTSSPRPLSPDNSTTSNLQPLEPPITKATLSELDVNKIVHNPKLRHDINYDPELHFRPNLDGEKGRKKQEKANQFYTLLTRELMSFVDNPEEFYRCHMNDMDWCLPRLLRAVKEILETLVPQRDKDLLEEGLNVELFMQQFYKGIADLEKLASWLSGILKLHCAPMRDDWVDEMYRELSRGNRDQDIPTLVRGMRSLLGVLEVMKLDVANHQIRCLRPVLIENTVDFEQRFFLKKIHTGRLNIDGARSWYQTAKANWEASRRVQEMRGLYAQAFGDAAVFFDAITKLILPSTPVEIPNSNACPNTFMFDEERIMRLRSDIYDTICLEICMRQFEEFERLEDVSSLDMHINFNAPQFSRPSSYADSDSESSTSGSSTRSSSARSSGYLGPSSISDAGSVRDGRRRARDLYNSLLALLQTAPSTSRASYRWKELASPIALQILRYVDAPHISLGVLEKALLRKLTDIQCDTFQEVETYFHQRLFQELTKRVVEFKNLPSVGLFSIATGRTVPGCLQMQIPRPQEGSNATNVAKREARDEGGIEDMATRLAHLGMLHWRVWAPIAYIPAEEASS